MSEEDGNVRGRPGIGVGGCHRFGGDWRFQDGMLVVKETEREGWLELRPVWQECANEFERMFQLAGLKEVPRLECVRSAGGYACVSAKGLVVVGRTEAGLIANEVLLAHRFDVQRLWKAWEMHNRVHNSLTEFVLSRTVRLLVAHQVGHLIREHLGAWGPFEDEEGGADFAAGMLDGALTGPEDVGKWIFSLIGTKGIECFHKTPCGRAHAFMCGREVESPFAGLLA